MNWDHYMAQMVGKVRELPLDQVPPEFTNVFNVCGEELPYSVIYASLGPQVHHRMIGGKIVTEPCFHPAVCSREPHDDGIHVSHGNESAMVWGGE